MAKKEIRTDLWVYDLLKDANIKIDSQGCNIKEIDEALKTASKKGTGNYGYPEYCGVVKDFVIVIEDKPTTDKQAKYDDNGLLDIQVSSIVNYALNGAYFYAKHILENTNYKKAIAFGISGDEKHHIIKPIYLDGREYFMDLPEVESFISFNENNIDEYYIREILKEDTDEEKTTAEILKDAKELHEYLRNYGNLSDKDKPLVVSGILLALKEIEYKNFSIDDLIGDKFKTDGSKIYAAIEDNLKRSQVSPETKKDKLLSQFAIIKDTVILNEVNETVGKTPLKYYTEYLYNKLYKTIRYNQTSEDYFGRFYGKSVLIDVTQNELRYIPITNVFPNAILNDGFDVIATNPPYKNLKAERSQYNSEEEYEKDQIKYNDISKIVKSNFKYSSEGVLNLYKLFVEEIIEKYANPNGYISLLIPTSIMSDKNSMNCW